SRVVTDRIDALAGPQSLQDINCRWIHTVGLDSPRFGAEFGGETNKPTDLPRGTDDAPSSRDRPIPASGARARFGAGAIGRRVTAPILSAWGFPARMPSTVVRLWAELPAAFFLQQFGRYPNPGGTLMPAADRELAGPTQKPATGVRHLVLAGMT